MAEILIINTGGTIGMVATDQGLQPLPGLIDEVINTAPEFKHSDFPTYDIKHIEPVIDSSNMSISVWNKLIDLLDLERDNYQGFVVLHGTDTMAYTAAVLSFALSGFGKPIILTGSQIPISKLRNDAKDNFLNAAFMAKQKQLKEVCIYFSRALYRGNRATKFSADKYSAFQSPNYPTLGSVGIEVHLQDSFLLTPATEYKKVNISEQKIASIKLFPGFDAKTLTCLVQSDTKALIIEAYGSGNLPIMDEELMEQIERIIETDCQVIITSQCPQRTINLGAYSASLKLNRDKVIAAKNMTFEACIAKTYYLLSKGITSSQFKTAFHQNAAGEFDTLD